MKYLNSNENVFVTGGSQASLKYLIDTLGVKPDNIINYRQFDSGNDIDGMVNALYEMNGNRPIDVTFDNVGGKMKLLCCKALGIGCHMGTYVIHTFFYPNFCIIILYYVR